jgi:glutamate-5-semialdehyde dehydrogenase
MSIQEQMQILGASARQAAQVLAVASTDLKNQSLRAMAAAIRQQATAIYQANQKDCALVEKQGVTPAFLDRLTLNAERIEAMARGLEAIAEQADPVGRIISTLQRPNGLEITRIRVPLGVLAVIYESRPNVTADAAGLCLKSGNAVILRGGSESFHSSTAIVSALHEGLANLDLPPTIVQQVPTTDREAVRELLKMERYIDVIIPRGGPQLIAHLAAESRIPLFKHLAGICHTYVHHAAKLELARKVVLNAKMRRTGICGATEVLLLDQAIAPTYLPAILEDLLQAGCEVRGDPEAVKIDSRIKPAGESDFDTEFLEAIIAVKLVANIDAAIEQIRQHGTQHTEAILTEDQAAAEKFLQEVDSAIVMHNTSTQFADGGEFGMGAEIGIATGKLHARGPVGAEQLTTFKYLVRGSGQVRS